MVTSTNFWKNKKVLITGHTGFKGGWLSLWLSSLGSVIKGFSLEPSTEYNLFTIANINSITDSEFNDILDYDNLSDCIKNFQPDIIFHMAAQPLVRDSYIYPIETYKTNVIGTANILEASRDIKSIKAIINITTDKVYENLEDDRAFKENDALGGYDPYSSSKACSELVTASYRRSFLNSAGIGIASARAGNVIGGGDWAKDRLLPEILDAFYNKKPVVIRNPNSTRPWQHVLEPLSGYIKLAEMLYENPKIYSQSWNFGPKDEDVKPVSWILDKTSEKWGGSPMWEIDKNENPHEAKLLKLDITKSANELKWNPTWDLGTALSETVRWFKLWKDGKDMQIECLEQINKFYLKN